MSTDVHLGELEERRAAAVEGLATVRATLARAVAAGGRPPGSVQLVAASKSVPAEVLEATLRAGQSVYGENRVQEAAAKWPRLRAAWPTLRLHLIGPLQSNKARDAVRLFDVIQSVDRPSLCRALAREMDAQGRRPRLLVQVNIGGEPQKAGVVPDEVGELLRRCRDEWGLAVSGLMCIPPAAGAPEPHFRRLVALADDHGLAERSMGMSGDYPQAVACGATTVRVGSSIFGQRPPLRGADGPT